MEKKLKQSKVEDNSERARIALKDGRWLAKPPSGGLYTKTEIRRAVIAARSERLETKAG